jgi:hypothetical protein
MSSLSPLSDDLEIHALSELSPRSIAWLWPQRLALGKPALLEGDPGLGKTFVALDLCARLSTGRPFPDGSPSPGPAASLILNGEDNDEDTIYPRLRALGADLTRIFVVHGGSAGTREPLRIPSQVDLLERALTRTRARLVVMDPVVAFLDPGVLTGSDASVRRALAPLARVAESRQSAVLLHRHLTKVGGRRAIYRGLGSIGFQGVCRSSWLVARDPKQPDCCVLAQVKNNLAPPQPSLAFAIRHEPPELCWLGPNVWSADQLVAAASAVAYPTPCRDRACEFLAGFLAKGPRTSREIWAAAQEQGLARRTLFRARRELQIRPLRVWVEGKSLCYWLLPSQQLPESVPPEAAPPDLEPWLAPLRERFPPSTPLDEL